MRLNKLIIKIRLTPRQAMDHCEGSSRPTNVFLGEKLLSNDLDQPKGIKIIWMMISTRHVAAQMIESFSHLAVALERAVRVLRLRTRLRIQFRGRTSLMTRGDSENGGCTFLNFRTFTKNFWCTFQFSRIFTRSCARFQNQKYFPLQHAIKTTS